MDNNTPASFADSTIPELPPGCGYTSRAFGAPYLDAECFGGQLYDMDSCDNAGNLYEPSEYIACPKCNLKECLVLWCEEAQESGYWGQRDGVPAKFTLKRKRIENPKAYKKLRKAWLRGWRQAEREGVKSGAELTF